MGNSESEVKNAVSSVVCYEKWLQTGDSKILDDIAQYNRDDCRSTYLLREWLLTLRPPDLPWMNQAEPTNEKKARSKSDRQIALEAKLESYHLALIEDPKVDLEENPIYELVFYLLVFHRRCEKLQWWAIFSRQETNDEELIDDPECIGAMTLARGKSKLAPQEDGFVYQYPDQELFGQFEMSGG